MLRFVASVQSGDQTCVQDRKSTRLKLQSHSDLVCRLLLEKKKYYGFLSGGRRFTHRMISRTGESLVPLQPLIWLLARPFLEIPSRTPILGFLSNCARSR